MSISLQNWCQVCNEEGGREQLPAALCGLLGAFGRSGMLCQKLSLAFLDRKFKKGDPQCLSAPKAFALIFLLFLCMLLCTSCSLLMPHTCPSLHPGFSPAFCASCAMFYLCITLPTALLNTSPCFALSCFHYSASPSFPVLLPQMLFTSLS